MQARHLLDQGSHGGDDLFVAHVSGIEAQQRKLGGVLQDADVKSGGTFLELQLLQALQVLAGRQGAKLVPACAAPPLSVHRIADPAADETPAVQCNFELTH